MERHRLNVKQFTPRGVHGAISDAKNALVTPDEYANLAMDPFSRAVAVVYRDLGEALRLANAVDFDDLLVLPVRLLAENPPELEKYRRKFKYLLVDEYQDTNRAQYQFIKLLAGGHGNVCVVGDDDQSIYGWRGADIRNILDFNKDFPEAHVVRLEENYRSTPEVLDLANVVISANKGRMGKTLRPTHRSGERVTAARCLDERDEADFIVEELVARRAQSSSLTPARLRDPLSHECAEPRDRGRAAQARAPVSHRRLGALLRPPRDSRSHELSQARRQSRRRRGLPPRDRGAEARARRRDARAALGGRARRRAFRCSPPPCVRI